MMQQELQASKLSKSDMKSLDRARAFFLLVGEVRRTVWVDERDYVFCVCLMSLLVIITRITGPSN